MGPKVTWSLAIIFTVWLLRMREASGGALMVAALAIVGGLARGIPMLGFLIPGALGSLHMEDEVGTGIWCVTRFAHPELAHESVRTLLQSHSQMLRGSFYFWLPALISLGISLTCLILAYRKANALFEPQLNAPAARWTFRLMPLAAYACAMPVLNALDRTIRINW